MNVLRVVNESISVVDKENELTMELFCSKDMLFVMKLNITEIFKYKSESVYISRYIDKNKETIENDLLNKIKDYLLNLKMDTNFYLIYDLSKYKYDEIKFPTKKSDNFLNKLINVITNDSEINIYVPFTVFCSKKDMVYEKIKNYEKSIDDLYMEKDTYTGLMNYLKLRKVENKIIEVEKEFNEYIDTTLSHYTDYFDNNFKALKVKESLTDELMQYGLLYSKDKDKFRVLIHYYEKLINFVESFKEESLKLNKKEYDLLIEKSLNDIELFISHVMNELKEEVIKSVNKQLDEAEKEIVNEDKINSIKTRLFNRS